MANLPECFLSDLDELSDNEADVVEHADVRNIDTKIDINNVDREFVDYRELGHVSYLLNTQRYIEIIQKVEEKLRIKGSEISEHGKAVTDYQLTVDAIALSADIEDESMNIHNYIRDKYHAKFPELASLVHHPVDYARVVKKIGNVMDLTQVDLEGLLPSAVIMTVSMIGSTLTGEPLEQDILRKVFEACDCVIGLDSARIRVLDFVKNRMICIAPNLAAVVGSAVAAKLMGAAGGLASLAKMPACDILVLGAKRKILAGFSTATSQSHVGYLEQTDIFRSTPPSLKTEASRLLAAKSALAIRVDSAGGDPTGMYGKTLSEEIRKKIQKFQEPPAVKIAKPLPVPDFKPKKKRGGIRYRKMKARYAITDMRKLANRMRFGVPEESSLGDGFGEGYGMLGQAGSGTLRVSAAPTKLAAKVANKVKQPRYGNTGATSGLTSSLSLTSCQGIEQLNPHASAHQFGSGTSSTYFSETGTFSKVKSNFIRI